MEAAAVTRQDKIDCIIVWALRPYTDDLQRPDGLAMRWQLAAKSDAEIDRLYVASVRERVAGVLHTVSPSTQAGVSGHDQPRSNHD
jgi:hypothetical protein